MGPRQYTTLYSVNVLPGQENSIEKARAGLNTAPVMCPPLPKQKYSQVQLTDGQATR